MVLAPSRGANTNCNNETFAPKILFFFFPRLSRNQRWQNRIYSQGNLLHFYLKKKKNENTLLILLEDGWVMLRDLKSLNSNMFYPQNESITWNKKNCFYIQSTINLQQWHNQSTKPLLPQRCFSLLRPCGCCWLVHMQTGTGKSDDDWKLSCYRVRASDMGPRPQRKDQSAITERTKKQSSAENWTKKLKYNLSCSEMSKNIN